MPQSSLAVVQAVSSFELPEFDLSFVTEQLASYPDFADWDSSRFDHAVLEYRRFLALCRSYPHKLVGLSIDADQIWHQHVLNTRRYIADCDSYFGEYFHHSPALSEEEQAAAKRQTDELYLEVFGETRTLHEAATCSNGCQCN